MLIDYIKQNGTNNSIISINTDKIVYISRINNSGDSSIRQITLFMEGGYTLQIDESTYDKIIQNMSEQYNKISSILKTEVDRIIESIEGKTNKLL